MKKIKELQKRSQLSEGRNFGIGFSILNKIKNKFETYLPFTACRDYLNDFIFVEETKQEIGSAHGYEHKLLNCFKRKQFFYLGVNTLDYNNDGPWSLKEKATKKLINNYKNLESFLNYFETRLNLKTRTSIEIDEDTLILKVPIYWSKSTPLISVYTLLIRCYFNMEDVSVIDETTLSSHKPLIEGDTYFTKHCVNFFNKIETLKFDKVEYNKFKVVPSAVYTVHNFGIVGYLAKNVA